MRMYSLFYAHMISLTHFITFTQQNLSGKLLKLRGLYQVEYVAHRVIGLLIFHTANITIVTFFVAAEREDLGELKTITNDNFKKIVSSQTENFELLADMVQSLAGNKV